MTLKILFSVAFGITTGRFLSSYSIGFLGTLMDIGLCALLFFVGIDIGKNKDIFNQMKDIGIKAISTPLLIAAGSIIGSIVAGIFLGYSMNESAAIGSGFGWYSLSAIIIAPYSSQLSALSFITNVSREIIAIICIPLVAKYIGYTEAIAPAGATAMDTVLPIISKATDGKTAVISFITGLILSVLVPILVPFFIAL